MPHRITLTPSGRQFDAEADETVLEAARRAGLALPYSCLGGRCGSCKATLVAGECVYAVADPEALDAEEVARHQVLLCQAQARSDLTLAAREVATVADLPRRQLAVKVVEMTRLAEDVMRLRLRAPRGDRLRWLAGQYIDVLVAGGKRRAFSIANAPEADEDIELHVRHVEGGGYTHHIFTAMKVGDVLRIEGPLGTFVPREDSERALLMVAGGTGLAPVKALIEHFIALGSTRPIHLYWGVRRAADLYLPDLAATWAASHPALQFTAVLSDPVGDEATRHRVGLVHDAVIADHPDLAEFDAYMGGPPAMINAARHAFVAHGLPEDRLYYDSFDYAPDVLAAILRKRAGLHAP
jgi:CDP-4-dehydro-6-deoxyglucose reductase